LGVAKSISSGGMVPTLLKADAALGLCLSVKFEELKARSGLKSRFNG